MTTRGTEPNNSQNAEQPPGDRERYLRKLQPLLSFLAAPHDLIGIFRIAEEFQKTIQLFSPLANERTRSSLERLDSLCTIILSDQSGITRSFPKAPATKRATLTDYYDKHPHYSIYWNRPQLPLFSAQWRALVATLLPIRISLDREETKSVEPYHEVSVRLNRYLRQLSQPSREELRILLELPVIATPVQSLGTNISSIAERLGIRLSAASGYKFFRFIARVIDLYQDGHWNVDRFLKRSNRAGIRSNERRFGATETENVEQGIELNITIDGDERILAKRYFQSDSTANPDLQTDPEEEFDSSPTSTTFQLDKQRVTEYHLQNRRRQAAHAARFQSQAIEIANQYLPFVRNGLTGYELTCFIRALVDFSDSAWDLIIPKRRPVVAAWAACRFFLSREGTQIREIRVGCEAVSTQSKRRETIAWLPEESRILLPSIAPLHATPATGKVIPSTDYFYLKVPKLFSDCLKHLKGSTEKLFDTSYETDFVKLINGLRKQYSIEITAARVQSYLSDLMSQLAPADRVISIYFQALPPNQHNPAVYSAISTGHIQSLYDEANVLVGERTGLDVATAGPAELPGLLPENCSSIGSRQVPQIETISNSVKSLQKKLASLSATSALSISELHNTYTAYVVFMLLATSGIRAISNLLPAHFDIDIQTGICFVSDKDNNRYGNAHLVWLLPLLVEQLELYREHTMRLRQFIALTASHEIARLDLAREIPALTSHLAPDRDSDQNILSEAVPFLFFLGTYGNKIEPVAPSLLATYLGDDWDLRLGTLRHFVRSFLLDRNCSGESINALLGHGERGEAPWGRFSTLPPRIWRRSIGNAMTQCTKRIGFKAIRSPLLRSVK